MVSTSAHSVAMGATARFARDNGLSLAVFALFAAFLAAQSVTGWRAWNEEQLREGAAPVAYTEYLASGEFLSATMENWESEFLQMAVYVLFTVFLFQRGSSESKKIGEREEVDRDPRRFRDRRGAPWPVKRGGFALAVYEHSLSLAFLLLFALSFALHAVGSTAAHNREAVAHGRSPVSIARHLNGPEFWFESFQNWQSEFLALGAMATLSIFLRQRGSPESKPVDAPHSATGHG
jgi:hypothetical protein